MKLIWRDATEADLGLLAEWNFQLIRDEGHRNPMTVEELGERMKVWLAGEYRAVIFGGSEPVAYALFREEKASVYLRQFFVVRGRRSAGVGRRAMAILREQIWNRDDRLVVEVLCANPRAIAFYRSVGFSDYCLSMEIAPRNGGDPKAADQRNPENRSPAGESLGFPSPSSPHRGAETGASGETLGVDISIDDLRGPEIATFLEEHIRDMRSVSPPESKHALDIAGLQKPEIIFWTLRLNGRIAGCCALKQLEPGHGEIKSMRTDPSLRRSGLASTLLQHVIREAVARGYHRLSLETGAMAYFAPARALYLKFGFESCPPFATYTDDPNSAFFTKVLPDPPAPQGNSAPA